MSTKGSWVMSGCVRVHECTCIHIGLMSTRELDFSLALA